MREQEVVRLREQKDELIRLNLVDVVGRRF